MNDPRRPPFAEASAAQVRAALTPEDAAAFEEQWRRAMKRASETLDLTEVMELLETGRRTAWLTTAMGHDRYREMLAHADQVARTGARPVGAAITSDDIRAMVQARSTQ